MMRNSFKKAFALTGITAGLLTLNSGVAAAGQKPTLFACQLLQKQYDTSWEALKNELEQAMTRADSSDKIQMIAEANLAKASNANSGMSVGEAMAEFLARYKEASVGIHKKGWFFHKDKQFKAIQGVTRYDLYRSNASQLMDLRISEKIDSDMPEAKEDGRKIHDSICHNHQNHDEKKDPCLPKLVFEYKDKARTEHAGDAVWKVHFAAVPSADGRSLSIVKEQVEMPLPQGLDMKGFEEEKFKKAGLKDCIDILKKAGSVPASGETDRGAKPDSAGTAPAAEPAAPASGSVTGGQ